MSEKNCTFKLGVEKKFDHEGKTIAPPPSIKWSAPKIIMNCKAPQINHIRTRRLEMLSHGVDVLH